MSSSDAKASKAVVTVKGASAEDGKAAASVWLYG